MAPDDPAPSGAVSVGRLVREATAILRAAGFETPALDARLLVAGALGVEHTRLIALADVAAEEAMRQAVAGGVQRRLEREPVSRILGCREFWGRSFELSAATLDPRPETETVVETALVLLARERCQAPRLIDLGTGTGCIVLTLLCEVPDAVGLATDVCPDAIEIARRNAHRLGVANRTSFRLADMGEGVEGPFDMVVANPPYVRSADVAMLEREVAGHDPVLALDGGTDGLSFYRRIAAHAKRLAPGGWVVLEVGHDQAEAVLGLARATGAVVTGSEATVLDLGGRPRCVTWRAQT